MNEFLSGSYFLDVDNPIIADTANEVVKNSKDEVEFAISLFYFVRDKIIYNPYTEFDKKENYIASRILTKGEGFCVQKAILFAALLRAVKIPAKLIFVDIKNYRAPEKLSEFFDDAFLYHGYCAIFTESRWVKAAPTFNKEMCDRFGYKTTEFDGRHDALLEPYDRNGMLTFEYVNYRGEYADFPYEEMLNVYNNQYGRENLKKWKEFVKKKRRGI